jgi:hypothetical protein
MNLSPLADVSTDRVEASAPDSKKIYERPVFATLSVHSTEGGASNTPEGNDGVLGS